MWLVTKEGCYAAAYSALTRDLLSKWIYLCRAVPNISNLLKPLDDILRTELIPALTGRPPPSDLECALFALPARLGGLGITIPSKQADQEHQSSLLITSALYDHIISQDEDYGYDIIAKQLESKATVRQQTKEKNSKDAHDLTALLSDSLRRSVNLAKEKGSSSWLTALPLTEYGSSRLSPHFSAGEEPEYEANSTKAWRPYSWAAGLCCTLRLYTWSTGLL